MSGDGRSPLADFFHGVRRHPITHGVFKNHGEIESLRLFCALDLLHEAVGEYKRLETMRQTSEADSG